MADIKLMIKIPEEIYKASQIIDVKYEDVVQIPLEVIKNATPLPKGCGDLVDRNDLLQKSYCIRTWSGNEVNIVDVMTVKMSDAIIEADKGEDKKEEPIYCDRNICVSNEYSGIECDECVVMTGRKDKE